MKKLLSAALMAVGFAALTAAPAFAALGAGDTAPAFTTQGSLAGKEFKFDLTEALKKGPVVLYFYPGAFTPGCNIEAHEFSEAADQFAALGATVVGASADDIAKLHAFSADEKYCNKKFGVTVASPDIIKNFDVASGFWPGHTNRTSYVIGPDGKILSVLSAGEPTGHIANALLALKAWRVKNPITK
jgi:thioredoxin-dependent peroxiredoxin